MYDTSVCVVGAHLSSGEGEGDDLKRNYDYAEIMRRGAFPVEAAALDPEALLPQLGISKVTLQQREGLRLWVALLSGAGYCQPGLSLDCHDLSVPGIESAELNM